MVLVVRQAEALVKLYDSGGELPSAELSRELRLSPQRIPAITRALQERGLVTRERRRHHVMIKLTEKGKRAAPLLAQLLKLLAEP